MARHDVFAGRSGSSYLLDVQAGLLDHLQTRVVVPLLPAAAAPPPIRKLHPAFEIDGHKLVMATHLIATVPVSELGEMRFSLAGHRDDIVGALDMLFLGF
ncbi:MAG: CcdB family protein [Mesorhizobium sp.]